MFSAQRANCIRASLIDLECEQAAGLEQWRRAGKERARGIETIDAAHQRLTRFELTHGPIQLVVFGESHVRRVRDDRTKAFPRVRQRVKHVPFANLDWSLRRNAFHVLTRECGGGGRLLHGHDLVESPFDCE